jgi:hypothetical protein
MDNPDTLATLGTQDTGRKQTQTPHTLDKTDQHGPHKTNRGVLRRRINNSCFI